MGLEASFEPIPLREALHTGSDILQLSQNAQNALRLIRTVTDNRAREYEQYQGLSKGGQPIRELARIVLETACGCPFPAARPDWLRKDRQYREMSGMNSDRRLAFFYEAPCKNSADTEAMAKLALKARIRGAENGIALIHVPTLSKENDSLKFAPVGQEAAAIEAAVVALTAVIAPQWGAIIEKPFLLSFANHQEILKQGLPVIEWFRSISEMPQAEGELNDEATDEQGTAEGDNCE